MEDLFVPLIERFRKVNEKQKINMEDFRRVLFHLIENGYLEEYINRNRIELRLSDESFRQIRFCDKIMVEVKYTDYDE